MKEKLIAFIHEGRKDPTGYGIYPKSLHDYEGHLCFMADFGDRDVLVADASLGFHGESFPADGENWCLAEETHENAAILRALFPFTAPVSVLKNEKTVGVGDRLGLATPGHIRAFEESDAYPVFAQQSMRELHLTRRSYADVIDCVTFAVFRENFTRGYGADGDHLKTFEEVEQAIHFGCTMITLDCSEYIRNDVYALPEEELAAQYHADEELEARYCGKSFVVDGFEVEFTKQDFMRTCLIYNDAIRFASAVYKRFFAGNEETLDFEVSIDETETPTTPAQHFYVANELLSNSVRPVTIAPRFCGDFQKGIDYIGDLEQFEEEFAVHAAIARHFGHKISVHSGSDKFSVFPIVGKYTQGRFHLKTSGTFWLEAMKIIAEYNPALYREIHAFALKEAFEKSRANYHVTTDLGSIPELSTLHDEQLPQLFQNRDARQLIHITYGMILDCPTFRKQMYETWRQYKEEYTEAVYEHLNKHLRLLNP